MPAMPEIAVHLKENVRDTIAIDLTASVGGVTLGLSRKKFVKVAAIEIDENRAEMCRQNMKAYDSCCLATRSVLQ